VIHDDTRRPIVMPIPLTKYLTTEEVASARFLATTNAGGSGRE
jgi:hypothetical protein